MDWLFLEKGKHEPGVVGKCKVDVFNALFQGSGNHVIHFRIALKIVERQPLGF